MDEDTWSSVLYSCTFGDIPIDVISTRDSFRRALVRHEFPGRDGARLADEGAEARTLDLMVLFFEKPTRLRSTSGEAQTFNHVQRAAEFVRTCNLGEPLEFVHPLFGSFPAMVESCELSASGDQRDQISVSLTLVEQGIGPTRINAQASQELEAGGAPVAAAEVVTEAATLTDPVAAEDVTAIADDTSHQVIEWETDPDLDPRSVAIALQGISDRISDAVRRYNLESDPRNYPLFRAISRLHAQVRRAALLARRRSPALIRIVTASDAPLRVILGDVYGARDADGNMAEVLRTNNVREPALVPAGTALVMPAARRTGRQDSRRQGPGYGRR